MPHGWDNPQPHPYPLAFQARAVYFEHSFFLFCFIIYYAMLNQFTRTCLLAVGLLLGLNVSAQGFSEVSIASGMNHMFQSQMKMGGGAVFLDYDADGDEDAVLTGGLARTRLYRNEGNGQFTDQTVAAGLAVLDSANTMGVAAGDIDNDGYRELFITTMDGHPNHLLYNNGDGTFSDITMSSGIGADTSWSCSAAFGDYDRDGDLDIFVCNYLYDQTVLYDSAGDPIGFRPDGLPDYLFRNEGNLTFSEVAAAEQVADSGCGLAVSFTDYNNDFAADILVANDHGMWDSPNSLFKNVGGQPCFSDVSVPTGMDARMYGMGIAVGDYDHDQDLDYYITDIGPNKLFRNDWANGNFTEVARPMGVVSDSLNGLNTTGWGTAWIDYDNDSWLDLFEANGHISVLPFIANNLRDPDKLYHNNGPGQPFTDVTVAMGVGDSGMARGMITGDYDNDGDEDLLVMVIHHDTASGTHTLLYRNDIPTNQHWMQLQLQGTVSNRDAFGAHVYVNVPGVGSWIHEVSGGGSHMSHSSSIVHFGVGTSTIQPEIVVRWPNGGLQAFDNLALDTRHLLVEDSSQFLISAPSPAVQHMTIAPNPNAGSFAIQLEGFAGEAVEIRAVDVLGRVRVLHAGLAQARVDVQAGALSAGVYLVELRTANGRWVERMVVR